MSSPLRLNDSPFASADDALSSSLSWNFSPTTDGRASFFLDRVDPKSSRSMRSLSMRALSMRSRSSDAGLGSKGSNAEENAMASLLDKERTTSGTFPEPARRSFREWEEEMDGAIDGMA